MESVSSVCSSAFFSFFNFFFSSFWESSFPSESFVSAEPSSPLSAEVSFPSSAESPDWLSSGVTGCSSAGVTVGVVSSGVGAGCSPLSAEVSVSSAGVSEEGESAVSFAGFSVFEESSSLSGAWEVSVSSALCASGSSAPSAADTGIISTRSVCC